MSAVSAGESASHDRIRLLFVTPSLYVGGAERQLVQLVQNLDPARYLITVAVFVAAEVATQEGFYRQVSGLPNVTLATLSRGSRFDLVGPLFSLVRLIRARQIQVIHTFLSLPSTFGVVASRLTGVPIVASAIRDSRDIGLVYRICRILQAHTANILVSNSGAGFDNRFRRRRANFRVIGNGLDLRRFDVRPEAVANLRRELGLSRFTQLVGMTATLSGFKDHEAFLRVAEKVVAERPETGFLVIGDGPNRTSLEALTARLGLAGNVVFTGYRSDVDVLTGMLDVACLFTNFRVISEGLPNAVMEAMACSVPVVATRGGGTVEIVHDGVEGFLVAENDVGISAQLVLRLLKDESLRRRLGAQGRASIEANFSLAACIARYEELYCQVLGASPEKLSKSGLPGR
ncbi:MAG: glycosyltransferase [Gammaproteobacteria bacterium]|nr:glycosyltransferase [Gammaproteobacteria bacterium]